MGRLLHLTAGAIAIALLPEVIRWNAKKRAIHYYSHSRNIRDTGEFCDYRVNPFLRRMIARAALYKEYRIEKGYATLAMSEAKKRTKSCESRQCCGFVDLEQRATYDSSHYLGLCWWRNSGRSSRWMASRWIYQRVTSDCKWFLECTCYSTIYYMSMACISKQRVEMTEDQMMGYYELADLLLPRIKEQIQTLRKRMTSIFAWVIRKFAMFRPYLVALATEQRSPFRKSWLNKEIRNN